jgi:D-glycero-D-manno-heptose 1,7-bisphosphate phosphatase
LIECIFLDRDGTLNRERADYVKSWTEFEWLPGALASLRRLAALPVPIVVISNQSAVGRGIISMAELDEIHRRMQADVKEAGGRIDRILVCPHAPEAGCDCRKPKPGLLKQAANELELALANCIFIGDSLGDWQAAAAAGCRSILVRTGRQGSTLDALLGERAGRQVVADLAAAVTSILTEIGPRDLKVING